MDTTHIDVKELCVRSMHVTADGAPEDFEAVRRTVKLTHSAVEALRGHLQRQLEEIRRDLCGERTALSLPRRLASLWTVGT